MLKNYWLFLDDRKVYKQPPPLNCMVNYDKGGEKMDTQNKQDYIDAWTNHISGMYMLCFTKDNELSKEVSKTLDKLKELVIKVAETKDLK